MHKYIFPRYEEFWGILKAAGKEVIFMADGCMDAYADDVIACGARGIITEPYTDYKAIARKHENCFLAGEGDNRILTRNDPARSRRWCESMVETAQMTGGYMMCIGNHIPWNSARGDQAVSGPLGGAGGEGFLAFRSEMAVTPLPFTA